MILMYHKVGLESPTEWWVSANQFYRQMADLHNKEVVYLDDYNPNNPDHVVITFDGVYQNVLQYAVPILKHFGYPFELFITSAYLGKDNDFDTIEPKATFASITELKEMENGGGRIQWHTQNHPDLKNLTDSKIINEELSIPQAISMLLFWSSQRINLKAQFPAIREMTQINTNIIGLRLPNIQNLLRELLYVLFHVIIMAITLVRPLNQYCGKLIYRIAFSLLMIALLIIPKASPNTISANIRR
jgi:peptidoglycan/xylan/chitin deacetylase (PgdA/CDA1 family)